MRKFTLLLMLLVLSLLVVPVTAQVGDTELPDFFAHTECEVDLSGETITIYHIGDISSPGYSPITLPLIAGLDDAMAYFNEHGGICGAEIVQDNRDTGGDPAQTQAAYDFYSTLDDLPDMLVLYSSQDSELLRPQVAEDEIPVIISAGSIEGLYGEDGNEPGWVYATNPLYADQFASFCDYAGANMENPVVGYIGWGGAFASFGQAAYTPETVEYCASVGVEVLETSEAFSPVDTDVSTQVENLYDAGANIIYVNSLATGPVRVAEAIDFLGLAEEVQLAAVNWGMDSSAALVARTSLGADGLPVINGMIGSLPFKWWTETDDPAIQLISEQAEANERELPTQNISYILGWTVADLYKEIYVQTVNQVGSLADVDGAAIKETIDSMNYDVMGGVINFNFNDGELRSVAENRIVQMFFANESMDGIAESGDDALKVPFPDGTDYFPTVIVPLTDFTDAPDMRPGAMEAMEDEG